MRHCGEQIEGGGRIIPRRLGQRLDTDHAGLIDAKVELPPATPAAATVCRGRPLTGPDDGQTRVRGTGRISEEACEARMVHSGHSPAYR